MGAIAAFAVGRMSAEAGWVSVSGGVYGVDMLAQLGALDVAGTTYSVVAHNVTKGLHPGEPRRERFEADILSSGGILSEHADEMERTGYRILQRDRIITGLADQFFVVESRPASGTIDAAKRAYLQGRKVVAIDWSRLAFLKSHAVASGNDQLLASGTASPFPKTKLGSWSAFLDCLGELLRAR
jgi:predicted Rossmann fold nucleotide-binding protein DprA/Smf involved in DNA uptake